MGHHVQESPGNIRKRTQRLQSQSNEVTANRYSVMLELQADCYAGVWAYHADKTRQVIEAGDIEEAMNAAAKIGDDALQNNHRAMLYRIPLPSGKSARGCAGLTKVL